MSEQQNGPEGPNPHFDVVMQVLRQVLSGEAPLPGQPTGRAWVVGEDEQGMTVVAVEVDGKVFHLRVPDLQSLASMVGPPQKPRRPLAALQVPYKTRTGPSLPVVSHGVAPGSSLVLLRAGPSAQNMSSIDSFETENWEASCFTFRGPTLEKQGIEYKPFNEDGVLLCVRRGDAEKNLTDYALLAVFDQAGGEGSVADRHGAGSEAAATAFVNALDQIAQGRDVENVLRRAMSVAQENVSQLGVGAVSTATVAVVETSYRDGKYYDRRVVMLSVGDSRALWVGANGRLRGKSVLHNLGSQVALGQVTDIAPQMAMRFAGALSRGLGTEDANPDFYIWPIDPGDFVVLSTDGIGDAHEFEQTPTGEWHADQCAASQAKILSKAQSSAQAIEMLVGYALDQVADNYGKPDNIGIVALRVL